MNSVSASAVRGMQERLSSDYLLFFSLLRDSYEHGSPMHRHAENAIQRVQQSLRLIGRLLGAGGTEITPVEVENLESELRSLNQIRDHLSEQMAKDRQLAAQLYAIERQTGVSTGTLQMSADTARRAVDSKKEQQERSRLGAVKFTAVASAIGHTTIRTMAPFLGPYAGPVGAAAAAVSPILGWGVRRGFQIGGAIKRKIGGMFGEREDESDYPSRAGGVSGASVMSLSQLRQPSLGFGHREGTGLSSLFTKGGAIKRKIGGMFGEREDESDYPSRAGGVSGASVMSLSQLRQPSLGFGHIAIDISRGLYDFFDKKAFDARWTKQLLKSTKGEPEKRSGRDFLQGRTGLLLGTLGVGGLVALFREHFPDTYEKAKESIGSAAEKTAETIGELTIGIGGKVIAGATKGFGHLWASVFEKMGDEIPSWRNRFYSFSKEITEYFSSSESILKRMISDTIQSASLFYQYFNSPHREETQFEKVILTPFRWGQSARKKVDEWMDSTADKAVRRLYPELFENRSNERVQEGVKEWERRNFTIGPIRPITEFLPPSPIIEEYEKSVREQEFRQEKENNSKIVSLLEQVAENTRILKQHPPHTAVDPNQLWYKTETDLVKSLNSNN